jgi:hypothetical protein
MTTVAAALALFRLYYRRSEPFVQTKLCNEFGHPQQIILALGQIGVSRYVALNHHGTRSNLPESRSGTERYTLEIERGELLALISELVRDAERQIRDEGGRVHDPGGPVGSSYGTETRRYRIDQTFGEIHISGDQVGDKKARLFIFIHEHRIFP